jgi:hypothetical protein
MANIQDTIGKGLDFACKLFGTGKGTDTNPRCKQCANKFADQFGKCHAAVKAIAKKTKPKAAPSRVPGFWGYAMGSFTDIFCNAICERPMTMNQAAAIIAPNGEPIGPHPKCKARLIGDKLAVFDGHLIYMRVYPPKHPQAGQLTPAAKIARSKAEVKAEVKAA